jgi:CitMHS family citrate-Mg2+:H+ or citrate-Ca2+:H+ symporter
MLALTGIIVIFCVLLGIMTKKTSPMVALISFPFIGAIILGHSSAETSAFIIQGLRDIIPVTGMIIFAILYFGVVSDAGMIDPIVAGILRMVGCKPARITLGTAILAWVIHLDGSGAVTIMLTVPAVLPLYNKLKMDRRILACIIAMSAGTNYLPWIGSMVRCSIVFNMPSTEIYFPLLPVHATGLAAAFTIAYWLGKREEKRLGLTGSDACSEILPQTLTKEQLTTRRPHLFWFNILLTLGVITCMIFQVVDAVVTFMLGIAVALTVNYRNVKDQMARIDAHARTALSLGSILMSAGAFVGIMRGTGAITAMAEALVTIVPPGMEQHMPFIVGIMSMPLSLFFDPDSFYFGVIPVIAEAYKALGGEPVLVGRASILGVHTTGFGISPLTPSCFLLIGMTNVPLADHQRFSIPFLWGISILMTFAAVLFRVFPL